MTMTEDWMGSYLSPSACETCSRWKALADAAQLAQSVAEKRADRLEVALLANQPAANSSSNELEGNNK